LTINIDYEIRLQSVLKWLKKSYYITGKKGFSIGFDIRKGWLAPYSETTGYIIPTLYRYSIFNNDKETSEIATNAARWLVSIQNEDGSINDFVGKAKEHKARSPVVFNTGQDLFGLLAAYRYTDETVFLDSAEKAVSWIISKQDESGLWSDKSSMGSKNIATYYTHVTWPMFLVGLELNDSYIIKKSENGLNCVISNVNENFSVNYWGFNETSSAYTHTIAYTIEGMFMQGASANENGLKVTNLAKNIADKVLELIEDIGNIAGSYDENWDGDYSYYCIPGNCQFAILYLYLFSSSKDKKYLKIADLLLKPVFRAQKISSLFLESIKGGVPGSWPPVLGKYMRWLYPNWAAKYLADAIMFRMSVENESNLRDSEQSYIDLLKKYPG